MDRGVKESLERKVLGELSNVKTEPISPTANLRLLTTLASNLKSASPQAGHSKLLESEIDAQKTSDSDPLKLLPRKEKSLGLLCNKFLGLYPLNNQRHTPQEISLDSTAKTLGTEKRRIYDIINVLESLEMASKAGKNRYLWHGQKYLPGTLAKLKSLAVKLGLREQIQDIQKINKAYTGQFNDSSPYCFPSIAESPSFDDAANDKRADNSKDDKSLGVMCQKFIMLFLVSLKNGVINLDIAAKVLITDADQSGDISDSSLRSRFKTKVRRLYDIANVLTAIGLIKKVSMRDGAIRKPVFTYTGPDVDYIDFNADTPIREGTRHSLIGMATPRRSFTSNYLPRISAINGTSLHSKIEPGSSTPCTERREPRKRKLFGSDDKFCRTVSSPCFDTSRPSDRLDDSILQVVEMELEKLKSNEQRKSIELKTSNEQGKSDKLNKPKACMKLFPRHRSDSCFATTQVASESSNSKTTSLNRAANIQSADALSNKMPLTNCSKSQTAGSSAANLVEQSVLNKIQIPNYDPQLSEVDYRRLNFSAVPRGACEVRKTQKLKLRNPNILSTSRNVVPSKLMINDFMSETKKSIRIAPYKIQPRTSGPKFVSLSNFDASKLIPLKPSQLQISLPVVPENPIPTNTSYAILTQVQTPVLSPGDLFKAVQVGNTLQLVPICNQNVLTITSEKSMTTNSS